MKTITTHTIELTGTHYEAGYHLGTWMSVHSPHKHICTAGFPGLGAKETAMAADLFSSCCPGLNEELAGFADGLKTRPENLVYYAMTWLHPGCSHMALLPSMTSNSHPLVARNYEFNDEMEDFTLIRTCIKDTYTHIGTSVLGIGRDDGVNEHGLPVTMSSCGFPVGANPGMRRPAVTGLQFWAVIRTLLDTCRDVKESLERLEDMPIAYNMNLILVDRSKNAALYETLDGHKAYKSIAPSSRDQYLFAANHPLLNEMILRESQAMEHSLVRCQTMEHFLTKKKGGYGQEELKQFLLTPYPGGLSCPFYKDFFGTTKSMVIDPEELTMDLCWGGREENGWRHFSIHEPFCEESRSITICNKPAPPSIFQNRSSI